MLSIYTWIMAHKPSLRGERGQTLIEYALLGGLIALTLMAVAVLAVLTGAVQAMGAGIGRCIDFSNAAGSECAPF